MECASEKFGNIYCNVDLLILLTDPPGQPEITGYKRNQAIRTNDTVQLVCTSVGGNPLAQIVWYKNNEQVDFSFTTTDDKAVNELTFTAKPSDNDAEYRCEAWNVVNADKPLVAKRSLLVHCK